jgi:hypothetical protein
MREKLVDKIALDNGLTLELWDRSRQVAGDRWLVCFVARTTVPVEPEYFEAEENEGMTLEVVRGSVGDHAAYVREKQSHFVDAKEKNREFERLKNTFLDTNLGYLSNPDFPRKLIIKAYRESLEQDVR